MVTNLGDVEITGEKTPVNVGAISDVGVIAISRCFLQNFLYQALVVAGVL
jgi:hypothetical protein